jgi:hypothetical protein
LPPEAGKGKQMERNAGNFAFAPVRLLTDLWSKER